MPPYTPLHHLVPDAAARLPVMASGNFWDEPQVIDKQTEREKLAERGDGGARRWNPD